MPSPDRATRDGAASPVITERMLSVLRTLADTRCSQECSRTLEITREHIAVVVRVCEQKLDKQLFVRRIGRGNTRWVPTPEAFALID